MRPPCVWMVDWNGERRMAGRSILEALHSARQVKMGRGSQTTAAGIEEIEEEEEGGVQSLKTGFSDQPIMYRYMCDYNGQSN